MRFAVIVFVLCIAYAASLPSLQENDDEALDLELRSILNHLEEEQETRAIESDEDNDNDDENNDDDDTYFQMSKRQGGHNIVDQQSKCEIQCIGRHRKPETGGGKSVKEAAKICRNQCHASSKKRGGFKKNLKGKATKRSFMNLREDDDNSDDEDNSSEDQERRDFIEFLKRRLQENNDN